MSWLLYGIVWNWCICVSWMEFIFPRDYSSHDINVLLVGKKPWQHYTDVPFFLGTLSLVRVGCCSSDDRGHTNQWRIAPTSYAVVQQTGNSMLGGVIVDASDSDSIVSGSRSSSSALDMLCWCFPIKLELACSFQWWVEPWYCILINFMMSPCLTS